MVWISGVTGADFRGYGYGFHELRVLIVEVACAFPGLWERIPGGYGANFRGYGSAFRENGEHAHSCWK